MDIPKKEDRFLLGQWVSPVLEYEAWIDWSKTDDAKALGIKADEEMTVILDGNYFLPKNGAYGQIKSIVSEEFKSGDFKLTSAILSLAEKLSHDCRTMASRLDSNQVTKQEFDAAFKLLSDLRFPWMACFPLAEASDEFITSYASEKNISEDEVKNLIPQLGGSITDDQQKLSRFKKEIQEKNISEKVKDYQKETEYIGTHHFWGEARSLPLLLDAIKNSSSTPQESVTSAENVDPAFNVIALMGKWRLECAQSSAALAYKLRPYMTSLASRYNLEYNDILFLLTFEIATLEKESAGILDDIRERQKRVGMYKVNETIHIITGEELTNWEEQFGLLKEYAGVTEVKGSIGNRGIVRGRVAIVLKPSDQIKVLPGMILISPETTPDFIPAMGRSAAFVTDQGGITSHAAIVAREMNKPCVIGTKIATKIFKDGDLVEVDAERGIVKIIS